MKQYPPDSDVSMLIAEDVRQEIGNKLSLAGWFTGGILNFDRTNIPRGSIPGMSSLCFVFSFKSGQGKFQSVFRLLAPSGREIMKSIPQTIDAKPSEPNISVFKLAPFAAPEVGTYVVEWLLDSTSYRRSFEVT